MTLISAHTADNALEEYRETLLFLRWNADRMLNQGEIKLAPAVFGAYDRIQQAIADHSTFDLRTQEAIALAVGAVDNCPECRFTHTVGCRAAGWTLEQAVAVRTGAPIAGQEKITALLAVARQAAGATGEVDKDIWQQALRTGWTLEELAELFTHVIAKVLTNYFNHCADPEGDVPAVSGLSHISA